MKVVELLKIGGELLKLMSENDVKRDDYEIAKKMFPAVAIAVCPKCHHEKGEER